MNRQTYFALIFSIGLVLAVSYPVVENWKSAPKDNFPLSYYPMFSQKRAENYTLNYAVGYDTLGHRHIIPYQYAGKGGMNQVRRQINKKCRKGEAQKLAQKIAKAIKKSENRTLKQLECIEIIRGQYNLDDYFIHPNPKPLFEEQLAVYEM
ncbi:MAG TPA: hypothetical protein PKA00_15115 [Saprospiraceae bacterium]|nr:hypothetical protein [Saprospiraceae bacterium]HMQ84242.1 hypothetical protein [Saprospiraceae bacterium]